jgi:hypothetical protein
MAALFLAVLLPTLFWDQPADTAETLRKAGIERLYVPANQVAAWKKSGLTALPFDRDKASKAAAPAVEYRMDVVSATRIPWVDANGWRFARDPARSYFYDVSKGSAVLAAAEAYAYGVEAAIRAAPDDLEAFARMLKFLGAIDQPRLPVKANIGVIDDGSAAMGEVLNLLARHNLLFRVIPAPDPKYDLNIRLGAGEFSKKDLADPYAFAMQIRHRLTDEKRLLRLYGSNVVLALLTGDGGQARVHLINYGAATVKGLRVRVLGSYARGKLAAFDHEKSDLQDYSAQEGAPGNSTEFTIPEMGTYAVIDLTSP